MLYRSNLGFENFKKQNSHSELVSESVLQNLSWIGIVTCNLPDEKPKTNFRNNTSLLALTKLGRSVRRNLTNLLVQRLRQSRFFYRII